MCLRFWKRIHKSTDNPNARENQNTLFDDGKSNRESFIDLKSAQCSNFRNLFSHFYDKNFVKPTFLLSKEITKELI